MNETPQSSPATDLASPATDLASPGTVTASSVSVTAPTSPVTANTPATAPDPMAGLIDISQFASVKMRVAQIKTVEKVEKSNKLYKIQVDVGEVGTRQIVSGIAKFYTPEQLIGRKIIIVANLKPAMLMGVESQGMLLAASSADKTQLSLLTPSEEMPVGSTIS